MRKTTALFFCALLFCGVAPGPAMVDKEASFLFKVPAGANSTASDALIDAEMLRLASMLYSYDLVTVTGFNGTKAGGISHEVMAERVEVTGMRVLSRDETAHGFARIRFRFRRPLTALPRELDSAGEQTASITVSLTGARADSDAGLVRNAKLDAVSGAVIGEIKKRMGGAAGSCRALVYFMDLPEERIENDRYYYGVRVKILLKK